MTLFKTNLWTKANDFIDWIAHQLKNMIIFKKKGKIIILYEYIIYILNVIVLHLRYINKN